MGKNIPVLLVAIIIIAAFFRLYVLYSVPPSASLDEASIGWNAYSILLTGKDEYGEKFPILLRAYDDWRPALYVYIVIPFIKLLGLNVLSVRLPSVMLSLMTIGATFFLVKEIFINDKRKLFLARMSSFLLAISPWHIYISRLGHEVNAGLSFVVFAILFFIKAINSKKKSLFLSLSSIFFCLALYTYQSEKIFIPLIILLLILVFKNSLLKIKREVAISAILGIILVIPITLATLSPGALIRLKGTSAFSDESLYRASANNVLRHKNEGNVLGEIINNRRFVSLKIFTINYLSHFNPKFLFSNSGDESFKAPNIGLFYVWEFPFLILGIVYLLRMHEKKTKLMFSFWILIAFIAPSLATGAPHAMRAFNAFPVPQILTTLGIVGVVSYIRKWKIKVASNIFYACIAVVIVYFSTIFYKEYFYSFPKNQSSSFQYSLGNAIKSTLDKENSYDTIVFSNEENLYQSYMFYLFYAKYDPNLYLKQGGTVSGGFDEIHKFGKYEFRPIHWSKDKLIKNRLFVGNMQDFSNHKYFLGSFVNLDGEGEIKIVQNK